MFRCTPKKKETTKNRINPTNIFLCSYILFLILVLLLDLWYKISVWFTHRGREWFVHNKKYEQIIKLIGCWLKNIFYEVWIARFKEYISFSFLVTQLLCKDVKFNCSNAESSKKWNNDLHLTQNRRCSVFCFVIL